VAIIKRRLTVHFARSVTFPGQVPHTLQVIVVALAEPSAPVEQSTFVSPVGTQEVLLADAVNSTFFDLVPTDHPELTERITYRIQWRPGGITGRTVTYDFAMPDADIDFDDLTDLGAIIGGETYLQQDDLGVAGRVARLNNDGHVVDAAGQIMATSVTVTALSDELDAETAARIAADAANSTADRAYTDTEVAAALASTAADLSGAVDVLEFADTTEQSARIAADNAEVAARIAAVSAEATARIAADNALDTRLDTAETDIDALQAALPTKADLVAGKIPVAQVPDAALTTAVVVADQAAMLALTTIQVQPGDMAKRPDGTFLLIGTDPFLLSNWLNLSTVTSVNGQTGNVVLDAADVGAIPVGGTVGIPQVTGLQTALDGKADDADVTALDARLDIIEGDATIVRTVAGLIPKALTPADSVFVNGSNELMRKDGSVFDTGDAVDSVNGQTGAVVLDLTEVAAAGGAAPISQVTGLQTALDNRVLGTDPRLTDARTPTAHAASHADGGSDEITVASSQVSGLDAILTGNGLTAVSDHEDRLASLELGAVRKGNWFDDTVDNTGVTDPADFQTVHGVALKGPFSKNGTGEFSYNADGVPPGGETYLWAYISPNGHLELREWNEANPPDPALATQAALDAANTAISGKQPLDSDLTAIAGLTPADDDIAQRKAGAWTNRTPAQVKTDLALTKADVGLANADNTSDANKLISTATQTALDTKQPLDSDLTALAALSPTDDDLVQRKAGAWTNRSIAQYKTDLALTKADVGLGNVDNTSDASKPISTATQAALNAKADLSGGTVPLAQIPSGIPQASVANLPATLAAKADLSGGKLAVAQIPDAALTLVTSVASKAAMLAQTTAQVQIGDITRITATADMGSYVLGGDGNPATEANWTLLLGPETTVMSVNGQTGNVVLDAADVGARDASVLLAIADTSGLQAALDAKATTAALTTGLAGKTSPADVQALLSGSTLIKSRVDYVATTSIASLAGQQSADGVLMSLGSIVLVTAQASSIDNGLFTVNSGSWARVTEMATGAYLIKGSIVAVRATGTPGATNNDSLWQVTSTSGVVGTNANNWAKIGNTAAPVALANGNGITISGTYPSKTVTAVAAVGGGCQVTASGIGVDTAVVARKATGTVPNGSTTATLTHNLNSNNVMVQIIEAASGNLVAVGATVTGVNTVSVEFASAPNSGQYRYICIG